MISLKKVESLKNEKLIMILLKNKISILYNYSPTETIIYIVLYHIYHPLIYYFFYLLTVHPNCNTYYNKYIMIKKLNINKRD